MQKTLLKMLTYELIERVARFDHLLSGLTQECDSTSVALLGGMQERLNDIKKDILAEKKFLLRMFDEKSVKAKDFQTNLPGMLERAVYTPYEALSELSGWLPSLSALPSMSMEPEVSMLMNEVMPERLFRDMGQRSVVFQPEPMSTRPYVHGFESVLLEVVPYLQRRNPLGWLGVMETYSEKLTETESAFKSLRTKGKGLLAEDVFFLPLVKSSVTLRLLGPAYYYYAVADALLQRDVVFLEKIEPALFYGLNYFNFVDKSLVILHEAAEKSRELFDFSAGAHSGERLFQEAEVASVLKAVEKTIPESRAFTEKHFKRALALQERLNRGTLISASGLYPTDEIIEGLNQLLEPENTSEKVEKAGSRTVYDMLTLVGESPNTPREIINAGWIHKLERSPLWLYDSLSSEKNEPYAGFDRLAQRLSASDHLLLKSIETSEIHRVLLTTV